MNRDSMVVQRQEPLRARYAEAPNEAQITDRARTERGVESDPFHGAVRPGSQEYGEVWSFGIHRAVAGDHDLPNPGDMLCAALASCLDSTIRIIADRIGVRFRSLCVDVSGDLDVRGTLMVDHSVPVGFAAMRCRIQADPEPGTDPRVVRKLLAAAETSCVNLQTLRTGVQVETIVEEPGANARAPGH